jgi:hypothetical protein
MVTALDPAAALGFIKGDGHGRGRGVAVFVQIHEKSFHRNMQLGRDCLDDAQVCLVRNETLDVIDRQPGALDRLFRGRHHALHRMAINFAAGHFHGVELAVHVLRGERKARSAARDIEDFVQGAIAARIDRKNLPLAVLSRLQDGRPGAVAK